MNDAPAIQAAIDAAPEQGGTVYLSAKVYTIGEPGRVTTPIRLRSGITLRGDGAATILRRAEGGFASPMIYAVECEGLAIRDLALDGAKGDATHFQSNQQGLWLSRCRDSVIDRVWAYDQKTNGIALEYCQGISVASCIVSGNLKNGFYLSGSDHITITGCLGHGNGSPGTGIGSSFSVACSWRCVLSGCVGWGDEGASLLSGRDTQYLSVSGGSYEGAGVSDEPVGLSPPGLDRSGQAGPYDGVTPHGTSHSAFVGLVVPRSRTHGIRFVRGEGNLIAACIVRNCDLNGVMLHGSARNTVRGNTITNVGQGGNPDYRSGVMVVADAQLPDGTGNVIESNGDAGVLIYANPGGDVSP